MKTEWRDASGISYYFDHDTGRILGSVFSYANTASIWVAKVEKSIIPYTNDNEVILGHFISLQAAKIMVENWWIMQERTLLEQ